MKVICAACGVKFSSPVLNLRRRDGKNFCCPNGHGQSFRAVIEAERAAEAARRAAEEEERLRIADEVDELEELFARVPTVKEHVRYAFSQYNRKRRAL